MEDGEAVTLVVWAYDSFQIQRALNPFTGKWPRPAQTRSHPLCILNMSESPAPSSFPRTLVTASPPNFTAIVEKALKAYKKKTKQDLTANLLATELQECDSPAAIVAILQDQINQFRQSQSGDERLRKWLSPTINVLYAFSETLGRGVGLVNINR